MTDKAELLVLIIVIGFHAHWNNFYQPSVFTGAEHLLFLPMNPALTMKLHRL